MGTKKGQKQKVILPPELPSDVSEDEIEVSDEDLQFVHQNREYAGFVSRLDTQSITKHVTRVADVKEDALEALYEKRLKKKQLKKEQEDAKLEVHRVDALPVKTFDGKIEYRLIPKASQQSEDNPSDEETGMDDNNTGVIKLTKAEKRAKLKKIRKEAKKGGNNLAKTGEEEKEEEEEELAPQAAVLDEVKKDITAEETFESKKAKIAELGTALLSDPESNIRYLKEFLQFCRDKDPTVVKLGLLSLLAVFKDIIPGYRIRLPTEKELEMKVSKDVKKMRYYESTLLTSYKMYLQKLALLEKQPSYKQLAVRCLATLLEAVPYFNFWESLLAVVVRNLNSSDDVVRRICSSTIKSVFTNEGKHGGEATVEAVRLIAKQVKLNNCQLHPDTIEVFLSLSFAEDLARSKETDDKKKGKYKKNYKRKNAEEPNRLSENDRKKAKREQMTKTRDEVEADYKSAAFTPDVMEQRRKQTDTLSAVFETYFRVLKHTMQPSTTSSKENSVGSSRPHPLLGPCLRGLGKFSHLIDMDFMGDLINHLKRLAASGNSSENFSGRSLTVSERLQCCIVAYRVMKINLEALNVDLQEFCVQLYNILLEYRPGRDNGEILAEALKIMLCDDRQHDMQKAAAFVKRLATFSLCFVGSAESMAALVTVKHLLQKNVKCRNLLENDAGGGSVSGSVAKYHPYATEPNLSGALASVLWELNLLTKHYEPSISTLASSITGMNSAHNQVYLAVVTPIQAFKNASLQQQSLNTPLDLGKSIGRRKNGSGSKSVVPSCLLEDMVSIDDDELRKKLSAHFEALRDIKENQRLRIKLDQTTSALNLYEGFKQQNSKGKKAKRV